MTAQSNDQNVPIHRNASGALEVLPSPTSSQADFDFFVGKWKIENRKLKTRLNQCDEWETFNATGEMYKILNGLGNIDNFLTTFDGQPFEGMSLRLFNPQTRLWSIYWADSSRGKLDPPMVGSFENHLGYFFARDVFQGKDIVVVFCWDVSDPNNPVWSQAFSDDQGETWEWNWYMYMHKAA